MLKQFFSVCLISLVICAPAQRVLGDFPPTPVGNRSAALALDAQQWVQADLQPAVFWRLLLRAETLLESVTVRIVPSSEIEAWVCGSQQLCLSTRLESLFTPAQQQAAIAHEIAHLVIPRKLDAHPRLWEVQADLLAAALLRDPALVREMLLALQKDCAGCRDSLHPAPLERVALLDELAGQMLAKTKGYDQVRHNFQLAVPLTIRAQQVSITP